MTARRTEPVDAYGWAAVVRNFVPYLLLLLAAPAVQPLSPVAPWLLAPLLGLMLYRLTIVMHDCVHHTLFRDANLNVCVGRTLGAVTGIDFHCFSIQHLRHHRSYGTTADPQGFQYVGLHGAAPRELLWRLLRPVLGFNLRYVLKETLFHRRNLGRALRTGDLLAFGVIQTLIVMSVTRAGAYWWLAPLPFISAATFGLFFSQLRGIAEHAATGMSQQAGYVRTHCPHWLDRVLLYDLHFNYHAEHHLHPECPSIHLPAVHQAAHPAPENTASSMFRTIASLSVR